MNYLVLGIGVCLILLGGFMIGAEWAPEGAYLVVSGIGLALALYAVFFHGSGPKLTGGKRIKDNWV